MLRVCILDLSSFSVDELILGNHVLTLSISHDEIREAAVAAFCRQVTFHLVGAPRGGDPLEGKTKYFLIQSLCVEDLALVGNTVCLWISWELNQLPELHQSRLDSLKLFLTTFSVCTAFPELTHCLVFSSQGTLSLCLLYNYLFEAIGQIITWS